jgi:hypothetical protein
MSKCRKGTRGSCALNPYVPLRKKERTHIPAWLGSYAAVGYQCTPVFSWRWTYLHSHLSLRPVFGLLFGKRGGDRLTILETRPVFEGAGDGETEIPKALMRRLIEMKGRVDGTVQEYP